MRPGFLRPFAASFAVRTCRASTSPFAIPARVVAFAISFAAPFAALMLANR